MAWSFPCDPKVVEEGVVFFRWKRIFVMFRPNDERFWFGDEAPFLSAGNAPADEFYSPVATELEGAKVRHAVAIITDYLLHIPVHGNLLSEIFRIARCVGNCAHGIGAPNVW